MLIKLGLYQICRHKIPHINWLILKKIYKVTQFTNHEQIALLYRI